MQQTPPPWLGEVIACPEDGAPLERRENGYGCPTCGRGYEIGPGSIVELLPDRLAHLGSAAAAPPAPAGRDEETAWVSDEMEWWNPQYLRDSGRPAQPTRGLRGRARERNLFRHVRDRVGPAPFVVEMGAGSSRTIAGLWPPGSTGVRYVASDLARVGLELGEPLRGERAAAVQCEAGTWPFREGALDVVVILGVLHHLPDWREALRRACRSVRPGGFVLLHEVVWKPRIFANRRASGINDAWTSPHEGHVLAEDLRGALGEEGAILHWRGESTPLRFALVQYGNLHERLEESRTLTVALDLADQAFGHTLGRLRPSLGFNEVTCVWQRPAGDGST